ncbi:hypothetical protein PMI01_03515 [Caulobacter sp. AP07]|uniref:hypothetical protein n=1 Tax=Caulobacter sp. AP07 TaxID=1144304 RepID=UPI000271E3F0|nr:hypothetical protein [Caulobacter sp. AP07]EJL28503.1 hypothetical protein PMI01_03515 [Caulobacter sp. AP07]
MGSMSWIHWLVVGLALLATGFVLGFPAARILRRAGFSPWWSFLVLVPYLNVVALWVFAFVRWPLETVAVASPPQSSGS